MHLIGGCRGERSNDVFVGAIQKRDCTGTGSIARIGFAASHDLENKYRFL